MLEEYEFTLTAFGLTRISKVDAFRRLDPQHALRVWAVLDKESARRLELELAVGNGQRAVRLLNELAFSCGTICG